MKAAQTHRRILFVDDEPNVLDGLRNLLRKERHQWDMMFVLSGKAALEELAKTPVDVVVSDMRMPGMDGAELLTRVKEKYPQVARIVLSGQAEREGIARVISVAHQFLSKPSDATTVRTVIERTCEFQALLHDEGIRRVVGSLERLPSLPRAYYALTEATADPHKGPADIAKIVETDPAMSAKVLQLVNSAYFGLAQRIDSITKAVTYMGIENLKGLLFAASVFGAAGDPNIEGFSLDKLSVLSLATANLARQIVKNPQLSEPTFAAGIVHDIGQVVLARDKTKPYAAVLAHARESGQPLHVVEKAELGITHGIVGAYLLGVWGLPFVLAETTAFHEIPSAVAEGNREILAAVHLADVLTDAAASGTDPLTNGTLDVTFLEQMGLMADLPKWRAKAEAVAAEVGLKVTQGR